MTGAGRTPADLLRPDLFLQRGGAVALSCADGAPLWVFPCRLAALDVLPSAGAPRPVNEDALATYLRADALRDTLARMERGQGAPPSWADLLACVLDALAWAYPGATVEDARRWAGADADPQAADTWAGAVAGAWVGFARPTDDGAWRARRRALTLAIGGVGDVPLSAHEAAQVADFLVNAGRAPAWR